MLILALALVLGACATGASDTHPPVLAPEVGPDDRLISDRWYVGTLDGTPMANLHAVVIGHPDGSRTTSTATTLVIKRELGARTFRMRMAETNVFVEDAAGRIESFRFLQEEAGKRITAVGTVHDDHLTYQLYRQGPAQPGRIDLADGVELLGQQGAQDAVVARDLSPGDALEVHQVGLVSGSVRLISATMTLQDHLDAGGGRYTMVMDVLPVPITLDLDADGAMRRMIMNLGFTIDFRPADGPAALGDAALALADLVTTAGPPPAAIGRNCYRLPADTLADLPEDAFQRSDGDLLVVDGDGTGHPPAADALLGPEPQLETGAQVLRDWVAELLDGTAEDPAHRAELLRQAVRGHLTGDLASGDLSALEAYTAGRGDCSEHANLLAAALRIAGIPARVEVGFVYAAAFGGWGGHAWVSAWDDAAGRWLHLDSAYPGVYRSCYIRTGSPGGTGAATLLDAGIAAIMGKTIEVVPAEPE